MPWPTLSSQPTFGCYVITGGTGAFAKASGVGTIAVALVPGTRAFTFAIHSE